jgi:hypothetical protein
MAKRTNYYRGLAADFSRPAPLDEAVVRRLVGDYERHMALRQDTLPPITADHGPDRIEAANREWWPARCAMVRLRRFDLMARENAAGFAYLCQDGPFHGADPRGERVAANWGGDPLPEGVHPGLARRPVSRRGGVLRVGGPGRRHRRDHGLGQCDLPPPRPRGGCYVKTEHLSFFRDVSAAEELLS